MFGKVKQTELRISGTDIWATISTSLIGLVPISSLVPANASALILHVWVNTETQYFGIRKTGSTDTRTALFPADSHFWCIVGIDSAKTFQCFIGNTTVKVYLEGYGTSDSITMFDNATDKTPITDSTWRDVDLAVLCPGAIGIVYEVLSRKSWGVRKNNSTDNRATSSYKYGYGVIGCDTSQIVDVNIENDTLTDGFFVTGYITSDAVFNTNATDRSLTGLAAYTDISPGVSRASFTLIEIFSSLASINYALRENGATNDIYDTPSAQKAIAIVPTNGGIIEGEISNTALDFFDLGYLTGGLTYPTDGVTRVTSLVHRYDRGTYTLEIGLGDTTADFGLPEWESRPRPALPNESIDDQPYSPPPAPSRTDWGEPYDPPWSI
jgi:hypothetical protein